MPLIVAIPTIPFEDGRAYRLDEACNDAIETSSLKRFRSARVSILNQG